MHDRRIDIEPGSLKPKMSVLECLQHCSDTSVYSEELYRVTWAKPHCAPINPVRANIARALDFGAITRVLLLNWEESVLPCFLGSKGIQVGIVPVNQEIEGLLSFQREALGLAGLLRVWSAGKKLSRSHSATYDLIVVRTLADRDREEFSVLINDMMPFLSETGHIVLALEGASDSAQYERLNQTIEEIPEVLLRAEETLLAFPSLHSPEVLVRERFLETTPGSWVHVAPYLDENGLPRLPGSVPKGSVWTTLQQHDALPVSSVDRILFLSHSQRQQKRISKVDFLHTSFSTRKRCFWIETTKPRALVSVCRKPIVTGVADRQSLTTTSLLASEYQHRPADEQYLPYPRLSESWLDALQNTRSGLDTFRNLVECYVDFLRQTLTVTGPKPLDLIPDNIVVDLNGGYHVVDQEWWTIRADFDMPEALYRGVIYFLFRHTQSLGNLVMIRKMGDCYQDFLDMVFTWSRQDLPTARARAELVENCFRDFSLDQYGVIDAASLECTRFDDKVQVALSCYCDTGSQSLPFQLKATVAASVAQHKARFYFLFPTPVGRSKALVIRPDCAVGPFRLNAVTAVLNDGNSSYQLIDLQDIEEISSKCSFHTGEVDLNGSGLFYPTSPNASVVVGFPEIENRADHGNRLRIVIEVSWPAAGYDQSFKRGYLERLWRQEQTLVSLAGSQEKIEEQLRSTREELDLLKSSKVWRIAERFRSIVYGSLLGRNKTVAETTSRQALTAQRPPASRIADLLARFPGLPSFSHDSCSSGPKFSIVLPVHDTPRAWLSDAVDSVRNQTYVNWELIVINDGSTSIETRIVLDRLDHPQIAVFSLGASVGISAATCHGIDAATGDFVAFIDHDDMLTPDALHKVAEEINRSTPDVLYTDETMFDDSTQTKAGEYFGQPHFKSDYSPELLLAHNYITHLLVVRKTLLDAVGGPQSEFDGAQDYELLLRLTEKTNRIAHVPEALYCWRRSSQSTSLDAGVKPEAHERGRRALKDALVRRGEKGSVLNANALHFFRVKRTIQNCPMVSIVVPFKDQPILLEKCVESIENRTGYKNFEIVGVDNGSEDPLTHELMMRMSASSVKIRFHSFKQPFNFPAIVNFGVEKAQGDHIVLMNNDIQVINSDWLEAMLEHSQRPEIGAVGAKLYYPNDTIQHAGIIIGIGGYAGHSHKHFPGADRGYLNRLNVVQNVSAVTGALLMCSKKVYQSVGGFDAEQFGVACNDVDFCLRLIEAGYRNVFTPYARAYHVESASRGYEDNPEKKDRFNREVARFQARHVEVLSTGDPYYNPNLTLDSEDFALKPFPAPENNSQTTT